MPLYGDSQKFTLALRLFQVGMHGGHIEFHALERVLALEFTESCTGTLVGRHRAFCLRLHRSLSVWLRLSTAETWSGR